MFEVEQAGNKLRTSTNVFNQLGVDGKGNDGKYFKYIGSLAFVHPVETSAHASYHGEDKFHCSPFVVWSNDLYDDDTIYKYLDSSN